MTTQQQNPAASPPAREAWDGMSRTELMIFEVRAALAHIAPRVETVLGPGLTRPVFLAMAQYASSFGRLADARVFAPRTWKRRRTIRRIQKEQEVLLRALTTAVNDELARRALGGPPYGTA
jgi:hypothetical protein